MGTRSTTTRSTTSAQTAPRTTRRTRRQGWQGKRLQGNQRQQSLKEASDNRLITTALHRGGALTTRPVTTAGTSKRDNNQGHKQQGAPKEAPYSRHIKTVLQRGGALIRMPMKKPETPTRDNEATRYRARLTRLPTKRLTTTARQQGGHNHQIMRLVTTSTTLGRGNVATNGKAQGFDIKVLTPEYNEARRPQKGHLRQTPTTGGNKGTGE